MTSTAVPADRCDFDVVSLSDVSKYYGRRRALAGVSLSCPAGTITGLLGPNGAGKSTLLGVLSTLLTPAAGVVTYGARRANQWGDVLRSRIGVLGHDLFLYSDLTARENLRFFGQMYGLGPATLEARVEAGLALAGLTSRANDRVGGFSRGMRQRLAVERALLAHPRLVLLDEPFTGLDDASVDRLSRRLSELRSTGTIIVMATHDLEIAEPIIDHAACLHGGRLRAIAAGPDALRVRYRRTVERDG